MIEITVLHHLEQKLQTAVYMEFPVNPPGRFVVLRKADSGRENYIDSAMFTARSYAESLLESAKLNKAVKSAMDTLPELEEVSSSRLNADYPMMDTANKRYCYQAVYDITHY